jgi:hypothetical protein
MIQPHPMNAPISQIIFLDSADPGSVYALALPLIGRSAWIFRGEAI